MSSYISITKTTRLHGSPYRLSASKSISNRVLMLKKLSGNQSVIQNLSDARDTVLMERLINSDEPVMDALDAGTTMRFLTAYFAVTGARKIMTGTARMKERPIGILVDALRKLGAPIDYLERDGYPPLEIRGFTRQLSDHLDIPGNVSSQYISALMMVAPLLPSGLTLSLTGKTGSVPYIKMTASLMKEFGVECRMDFEKNTIHIPAARYQPTNITVEADWSAISYWYGFVAMAEEAELTLPNVSEKSLQGDRVIADIMKQLGVCSTFRNNQVILTKQNSSGSLAWDFKDCPDLAQTVLPVCAAKGISGEFTGMESLRIKETDRIAALQKELAKIGATLTETETGKWILTPGHPIDKTITIDTYHDHRMAMGFAPWATFTNLIVNDPAVVNKSYPGFWEDMREVGFGVEKNGG